MHHKTIIGFGYHNIHVHELYLVDLIIVKTSIYTIDSQQFINDTNMVQ